MGDVRVARFSELPSYKQDETLQQIDCIFFEASAKHFPNEGERLAFHKRWLGRYLEHYPQWAYVALSDISPTRAPIEGAIGYLVGCLDDPAENVLFRDIPHFSAFRALTPRYPAHLHINLDSRFRGKCIGKRLVETFIADAKSAGVSGVHVVTVRGARNVRFYEQCGFREVGGLLTRGSDLVFLAQSFAQ